MYYPLAGRGVSVQDVREYARVIHEIDEERLELAALAAHLSRNGCGAELSSHKERLCDLAELEEAVMIRTRYVDFGPHWRAHRRFQRFLNTADSREELLFCSDWLRQHESAADTEFRQWLRHNCGPEGAEDCRDCLYRVDPERILLTVKMTLVQDQQSIPATGVGSHQTIPNFRGGKMYFPILDS